MAAKIVLASRRFHREFTSFVRKYSDLKPNFDKFLSFRATARPDQSFNSKDSRIPKSKLWHCHLVHGKAILIYQLHGAELRLITLGDHNTVESGSSTAVRDYARRLTRADYHRFDMNGPDPTRPTSAPMATPPSDQNPLDEPVAESEPHNPLWSGKTVEYLQGGQLLYQPKPSRPLIVLRLTKELIAPKGDVIVIDMITQDIYHLTEHELVANFEPAAQVTTSIGEAIAASIPDAARPEPQEPFEDQSKPWRGKREFGIGPQIGRLIMAFAHLQATQNTNRFDTATIGQHMHERDQRSLSALMVHAQTAGLIKKAGKKPGGRGFFYSLTSTGERTSKTLGDWPYTVAGLTMPKN